jgi:hypothetical protein
VGTKVFDVAHDGFVARRLEVVFGMEPVPPSDEYEYRVGLSEGRESWQLEDRQAAERCRGLQRRPVGRSDANVVEFQAGEVEREAALLTTASK